MENKPLEIDPNFDRLELLKNTLKDPIKTTELGIKAHQKVVDDEEEFLLDDLMIGGESRLDKDATIKSDELGKPIQPNEHVTKVQNPFKDTTISREVKMSSKSGILNPEDGR